MRVSVAVIICILGLARPTVAQTATAPQPAALTVEIRPILSPEEKRLAAVRVIDGFVEHIKAMPGIDASARQAVIDGWKGHHEDADPQEFLTAGLAIVSAPFKTGFTALEEQNHDAAVAALAPLAASDDPYMAIHASTLLARSLVEQEKLEEAQAILTPLAAREKDLLEKSFLESEVDFLLGYAQLSNLHYEEARRTLEAFERQHPGAPERLRLQARQMLQEVGSRQPDGLGDVSDLMVYAGRRLANGEPGKPVQIKQDRAVELLSKLIKEAQDREDKQKNDANSKSSGGGNGRSGTPRGNRQPRNAADRSVLPEGRGEIGDLHRAANARPGEEWGRMRPEDRERILQSMRKNFPSRYRQLVEQYYKQLAKEK